MQDTLRRCLRPLKHLFRQYRQDHAAKPADPDGYIMHQKENDTADPASRQSRKADHQRNPDHDLRHPWFLLEGTVGDQDDEKPRRDDQECRLFPKEKTCDQQQQYDAVVQYRIDHVPTVWSPTPLPNVPELWSFTPLLIFHLSRSHASATLRSPTPHPCRWT